MVVKQTGQPSRTVVVGASRSRTRYLPSSTFKIPNSLIAIDAGVASGAEQRYPGPNPNYLVDGNPFLPSVCEGDLTLRTAFRNSCIPMVVDESSGFVLRAKTGYVFSTTPARGWWVGWVQRPGLVSTFALNLDITAPAHAAARTKIGTEILTELGAFG